MSRKKKINFKKRRFKQFVVLAAVSTQLMGATQIYAYHNSKGDQFTIETSQLERQTHGQYPEWHPSAFYTAGDRVIHNGQIWEALVTFQGYGDMSWAPAINSTLWRLIGHIEPDQDAELDEASSEGLGFSYHINHINGEPLTIARIESFNGTQNNVLIPDSVMHEGVPYLVTMISEGVFMDKGIKRLEFESTNIISFGIGAFAGNPLESIYIEPTRPEHTHFFTHVLLLMAMYGVTTETVLYEGGVPTHQWDGNRNWIPIN